MIINNNFIRQKGRKALSLIALMLCSFLIFSCKNNKTVPVGTEVSEDPKAVDTTEISESKNEKTTQSVDNNKQDESPNDGTEEKVMSESDISAELYSEYSKSFLEKIPEAPNADCILNENVITEIKSNEESILPKSEYGEASELYIGGSVKLPAKAVCLSLPDSVVGILSQNGQRLSGRGAFYGNKRLSAFIPSEKLTYIGNKAFYECTSLSDVFFPISLTHIGDRAFYGCSSLENIEIHGKTSIGEGAFVGCSSLKNVYLSEKVQRVGLGAFQHTPFYEALEDEFCIVGDVLIKYNGSSREIIVPENVRIIADGVFSGRASLESVVLPAGLEYVGNSAFNSCARLSEIVFNRIKPPIIGENAFDGCSESVLQEISELTVDKRDEFYS